MRSAWERVTEREEFVGRLSEESRLPQYLYCVSYVLERRRKAESDLTTAMFTGAVVLALYTSPFVCLMAIFSGVLDVLLEE